MGNAKSLILGAVGLAVLVALVLLFMKVNSSPAHEVDEAKLQQAQANYQRQQSVADRPGAPGEVAPRLAPRSRDDEDVAPDTPVEASDDDGNRPKARADTKFAAPNGVQTLKVAPGLGGGGEGGGGTLRGQMDGANTLYDKADYEGARAAALEVLEDHPNQVRMLRIVVSSSCIMGDHDMAGEYFDKLTRDRDRDQMSRRCGRYGVELQP